MAKRGKPGAKRDISPEVKPAALTHNPFAALSGRAGPLAPAACGEPEREKPPEPKKTRGRLVLRRETKHRAGKAVIVVSGFTELKTFDAQQIEKLAKALKQKLACGGSVETKQGEREIVLQGYRPAEVAELLRAEGFRVVGVTA